MKPANGTVRGIHDCNASNGGSPCASSPPVPAWQPFCVKRTKWRVEAHSRSSGDVLEAILGFTYKDYHIVVTSLPGVG